MDKESNVQVEVGSEVSSTTVDKAATHTPTPVNMTNTQKRRQRRKALQATYREKVREDHVLPASPQAVAPPQAVPPPQVVAPPQATIIGPRKLTYSEVVALPPPTAAPSPQKSKSVALKQDATCVKMKAYQAIVFDGVFVEPKYHC